jgi:hypothetical protein
MFELVSDPFAALIVWPEAPPASARLQSELKTWLTARAGDVVEFQGEPMTIKEVTLYSAHPADQRDRVVKSGAAWLAGE